MRAAEHPAPARQNPDAVVVYNERNDKVLAVAATEQDAADVAAEYRSAWNYSSTFVPAASFVGGVALLVG